MCPDILASGTPWWQEAKGQPDVNVDVVHDHTDVWAALSVALTRIEATDGRPCRLDCWCLLCGKFFNVNSCWCLVGAELQRGESEVAQKHGWGWKRITTACADFRPEIKAVWRYVLSLGPGSCARARAKPRLCAKVLARCETWIWVVTGSSDVYVVWRTHKCCGLRWLVDFGCSL